MERKRVNSSRIRSVGYDEKSMTLEIEMSNGQPAAAPPALRRAARAFFEQNRPEWAINCLRRALAANAADAATHAELGRTYLATGWPVEADAGFRAALVADPSHQEAQAEMAAAQFAQDRLGDARCAWLRSPLALKLRRRLLGILRWNAGQPGTPVAPGWEVVDRHLEETAVCSRARRLDVAAARDRSRTGQRAHHAYQPRRWRVLRQGISTATVQRCCRKRAAGCRTGSGPSLKARSPESGIRPRRRSGPGRGIARHSAGTPCAG